MRVRQRHSFSCRVLVTVSVCAIAACERGARAPGDDSAAARSVSAVLDSVRPAVGTGWDPAAGPFVVLPTVDGAQTSGSLIRPDANDSTVGDTTGLHQVSGNGAMELFSRGTRVGEAVMSIEKSAVPDSGCSAWPTARLVGAASATMRGWTAAFLKGRITQIGLDSIEGLGARDSASMAANIARVASSLPDDTVATFRGLPFVVLRAFRGQSAGQSFVVTTLVRRVNQEDAPREERLVMVIDGEPANPLAWSVGWHERAAGTEDELVVSEPLVAFQLVGKTQAHLLFGRDDGEALSAAVLIRGATSWKVLWESALAGCER